MNWNFLKKAPEVKPNEVSAIEEIKTNVELEDSKEHEISPERIEALKDLDNEIKEIASLKEEDLVESIETPEEKKDLSEKLSTLAKIAETLKTYGPEMATALVGIAALAYSIINSVDNPDAANSAIWAEQAPSAIASAVTAVSIVASSILYGYKSFLRKEETKNQTINNSSEAMAA